MDPFAIVIIGALAALVLWVWVLGRYYPGSGMEQLGLRSARQIVEEREELEAEDLTQMLAAHNERRRRRGKPEVTVSDRALPVHDDYREVRRRREAYLADRELDQLLEATNARRRARGLPERSREDVQREFGGRDPAGTPEAGGQGLTAHGEKPAAWGDGRAAEGEAGGEGRAAGGDGRAAEAGGDSRGAEGEAGGDSRAGG